MEAYMSRKFTLEAHGADVDVVRNIVILAIKQLRASPEQALKGTPLTRQAGMVGNELINVKNALEKLAAELGLGAIDMSARPALDPLAELFRAIFDLHPSQNLH